MYFETRSAKNTASLLETPSFNYGVPYTLHPAPYTLFMQRIAAELAKQAPDFWSWRGGVFEFFQPMEKSISSLEYRSEIPQPIESEAVANIAELQQQIENLKLLEPDSPLLGSLYQELGEAYFQKVRQGLSKSPQTDLDLAIASLQQAAREFEKSDRKSELASALEWIGYVQKSIGDWNQAEANFQKSLQIRKELEDLSGVASAYGQLGDIERDRGNWDAAESLYRQSLQMFQELGDRAGVAISIGCLGENELGRGNLDKAEELLTQALKKMQALGMTWHIAETNWDLARLYKQRGNLNLAQEHYEIAHQLFTQLGAKKDVETIKREWRDI